MCKPFKKSFNTIDNQFIKEMPKYSNNNENRRVKNIKNY